MLRMKLQNNSSLNKLGVCMYCYRLNCAPPLPNVLLILTLSQNVTIFGDRAFKEVIKLNEAVRIGPNPMWPVSLLEEIRKHRETRGMHADRAKTPWRGSKKMVICKPRRQALGGEKSADTMTLVIHPPKPWENKCLLFKPPTLWYFYGSYLSFSRLPI